MYSHLIVNNSTKWSGINMFKKIHIKEFSAFQMFA